ncbi:hypothetical protein F2Q69_00053650 [Brassica cretica]|uniref:F-box associated beta-propeller type 1 domain-containing protein n=1 Tax=Brassica cretica TaxID=69181 RepID=A0A8S9MQP8_BRACR|nr:hypothetical protein F2Q69_00053650 [Brassica cretica]
MVTPKVFIRQEFGLKETVEPETLRFFDVPATTLRRLRPTCKQCNALLKDQIFTEKHHRKAPKQPLLLMLKEFRVCPLSVEIDLSVAAPSIEFKDPFDLKGTHSSSQQVNIVEVIHCEGETKWIAASSRHYKKKSCYALGYKNNKSYRNYKILRYWQSELQERRPNC